MQTGTEASSPNFSGGPTPRTTRTRLALGLLQGLALYALYQSAKAQAWPATQPQLFAPLLMLSVFLPLLAIGGWGRLSSRGLAGWLLAAGAVVAVLGWYDLWRMNPLGDGRYGAPKPPLYPSVLAWVFFSAGLFMAHVLVLSSAQDGRRMARYTTYFDQAWKLFIQHVFSAAFVGALWLVLYLGAALFKLIGLRFLQEVLGESWFAIPVSTCAMALGLHLTDVKPDIVRGIRQLMLTLLSWILPVIALLASGFLASLPVTGLAPLWATRQATAVLLGTAAALVILINTAFQSGERSEAVPRAVRACARLACVLLLPIVGIALYALSLRIGQYGWTSHRVIASACVLVAGGYAMGYLWAALDRGGWLRPVAHVNVWATWLILAVLMALFSPLADPARLSVSDQLARLRDGRTSAGDFDYLYLRFDAGRHGHQALQALARGQDAGREAPLVAAKAQAALKESNRWAARADTPLAASAMRANIQAVWPAGAVLPERFTQTDWRRDTAADRVWRLPACMRQAGTSCEAVMLSLDDDDALEVLILQDGRDPAAVLFDQDETGRWRMRATWPDQLVTCQAWRERLREGRFVTEASRLRDLRLGDRLIPAQPEAGWAGLPDRLSKDCEP